MRIESGPASEAAEVEPVTAAGIENHIAGRGGHDLLDRAQQRLGHTAIVQSPPPGDGGSRVARMLGSALLRLKQVDVSAARDVERMAARTEQPPLLAQQRHVAAADGTLEH